MPELTIDALAMAVAEHPVYHPVSSLTGQEDLAVIAQVVATARGVPVECLAVLAEEFGEADLARLALAELGPPRRPESLYLVQPDQDVDPFVAELPRLVHELAWTPTEDLGLTQLDELGGIALFDLLGWALPDGAGATAAVVDRPPIVESDRLPRPLRVLALRIRAGAGPVRVVACGEGAPTVDADHRFAGRGPCDAWEALHRSLRAGSLADGERVLLHTHGLIRQGWLLLELVDIAQLTVGRCVHYGH
jgi:hypothetical protein